MVGTIPFCILGNSPYVDPTVDPVVDPCPSASLIDQGPGGSPVFLGTSQYPFPPKLLVTGLLTVDPAAAT